MLGLKLRPEFAGERLSGTVVSLNHSSPGSFVNQETSRILDITYPTIDVLRSLEACFNPEEKRCLVIMGDRGQGKSHIMGLLHHAYRSPASVMRWLDQWGPRLSYSPKISSPRVDYHVITVALHEQEFSHLWSPLFEQHPEGKKLEGKLETRREIEGGGQRTPSRSDLEAAFKVKPTVLILDEFQTWYENLEGVESKWAFNFVQLLSEIAADHPSLLKLAVSVRDGDSECYKQLHRLQPFIVNFQGDTSKQDRHKLLVHRLFENRAQINVEQIKGITDVYLREWCRLFDKKGPDVSSNLDQQIVSWPFSNELLALLDEQLSLALNVQGTRDFIIVLANLFKKVGDREPIITPAHFGLDEEKDAELDRLIAALGNQATNRLAKIALQNIKVVKETLKDKCPEIAERALASLYIRSLSMGNRPGALREQIQSDLSVSRSYEDAIFKDDWAQICENSFNIHESGGLFAFRTDENPRTKILAHARNSKLFEQGQDKGKDLETIRKMIETTFAPKNSANLDQFRYSVLGKQLDINPFGEGQFSGKNPSQDIDQGQACYVFFPIALETPQSKIKLTHFIHGFIKKYRNLCRFVVPTTNVYEDGRILLYARALYFADLWKSQSEYAALRSDYERQLVSSLTEAYRSIWIIDRWDHNAPDNCSYTKIEFSGRAQELFIEINRRVTEDYFSIDDCQVFIENSVTAANVEQQKFSFLRSIFEEPRPFPEQTIPWTGPVHLFEVIRQGCLEGRYAIKSDSGLVQTSSTKTPEEVKRDLPQIKWNQWGSFYVMPRQDHSGGVGIPKPNQTPTPVPPPIEGGEGGGSGTPVPSPHFPPKILKESGYFKKPIEIEDEIERWGVSRTPLIHDVSITLKALSGTSLRKIIQAIASECPDGDVYLKLLKEEEQK